LSHFVGLLGPGIGPSAQDNINTENAQTNINSPVEFEASIPVFELQKTLSALDIASIVVSLIVIQWSVFSVVKRNGLLQNGKVTIVHIGKKLGWAAFLLL
jgi:hypothetical protein